LFRYASSSSVADFMHLSFQECDGLRLTSMLIGEALPPWQAK
jgi:hypothetical protein